VAFDAALAVLLTVNIYLLCIRATRMDAKEKPIKFNQLCIID
jgi:hypothetical protein